MKKNTKISALAALIAVVILVSLFLMGQPNKISAAKVTDLRFASASSLPPTVCGGIATQGWYLYSTTPTGPFSNETVGACGISSSASCNFPAGYYAC
jgi:hypothetical protein